MEPAAPEAELLSRLEKMERSLTALAAENEALRAENKLLRAKVDKLVHRIFGKSSEQISPAQLELLLQYPEESPGAKRSETDWPQDSPEGERSESKESASPCSAPGADTREASPHDRRLLRPAAERRSRLPEHLPVIEQVIEPEQIRADPAAWKRIGEEVSEQLDYEPARFLRRRTVRPKYVRRGDMEQPPVIAPLPPSLQEACLAAPGLIAAIITAKYCDHLPLYRQEMIYQTRHGVPLSRQTMSRWMTLAAFWLRPLYEEIKTTVLDGGYVQADESPVEYLQPGHGSTKTGYLWALHRPGGDTFYTWQASRAAACLDSIIPDSWAGIVQCDGYAAYPAWRRARAPRTDAPVVLAGCMAHARRGFFESLRQAAGESRLLLRQFQHLYAIEARLRESKAGPALRHAVRAAESRPVLLRLQRWCRHLLERRRHLPQSDMGKAVAYFVHHSTALSRFLEDGRIEIDNNLVENAIRPTAVGKKNWLFIGAETAGETSAILYTLVESARRRGLDPLAYLRDALTRLPRMKASEVITLHPAHWQPAAPSAVA
jgi:transposase